MKSFLIKFILLLILVMLASVSVIWLLPVNSSNYLSAARIKHQRLEKTAACDRIILVGGSNLTFGVDSALIEGTLHRPVVNMALHATLGLRYWLNEIVDAMHKGDIVVLIPEYSPNLNGDNTLLELMILYPEGAAYLGPRHYLSMLIEAPLVMHRRFNGMISSLYYKTDVSIDDVYTVRAFNRYGDAVGHLKKAPRSHLSGNVVLRADEFPYGNESEFVSIINAFTARALGKGATLVFGFPPVPAEYIKGRENLSSLSARLRAVLTCAIIGNPEKCVMPEKYFFDTVYHLNAEGRKLRTEMLISDLRKALPYLQ